MSTATDTDQALADLFALRGAVPMETAILQPAEPYLDTAGEALRRRIFLTTGGGGENLCLRPDFTIPVCLDHIVSGADLPRRYSYRGLVFRRPRDIDGPNEIEQAGIEDLGETNLAMADARALADALASLETAGLKLERLNVVLGDQGLFEAFLRALGLPDGWQRRLIRTFGEDRLLDEALTALAGGRGAAIDTVPAPLVELARAREEGALTRAIRDLMEEGGLPPHSGRAPLEVAQRLIEKVAIAEARLPDTSLSLLRRFLSIDCALSDAPEIVRALAGEAGLELGRALTFFEARNLALRAADVPLDALRYRAAFGRPLDYYTGLVFEALLKDGGEPLVGGGRYDRLLRLLGAAQPIPAVGFTLWLGRMREATNAALNAGEAP